MTGNSELTRKMNSVRRQEQMFKAFCEGSVAGMKHDGGFATPEEFGDWVRDEFNKWRDAELEQFEDNNE